MPSVTYNIEDLPTTLGWVYDLNAQDAITQCQLLGITPEATLAANRVLIKNNLASNHGIGLPTEQQHSDGGAQTSLQAPAAVQATPAEPAAASMPHDTAVIIQSTLMALGPQLASAIGLAVAAATADKNKRPPKVIEDLISATPVASGDNTEKLVRFFLIKVKSIVKLNIYPEREIILSLLTRTSAQLQTIWSEAVASHASFDHLKDRILNFFIPPRIHHGVLSSMFYRQQERGEPLLKFCSDIIDIAGILLPGATDREVLEVILTGLRPEVRARLAGFPAPLTTHDLISLAPKLQVIGESPSPGPSQQYQANQFRHFSHPPQYQPRPYTHRPYDQQPYRQNYQPQIPRGSSPRQYGPGRSYQDPYHQGNARRGR